MKPIRLPTRIQPSTLGLGAAVGVSLLLALGIVTETRSQTSAAVSPDENGFVLRATLVEVMDAMVMAPADVLWNAVGVSVTEEGIVEMKPETDEDWQRLRLSAVTLAEASNALIIPGRGIEPPGIEHDPESGLGPDEIQALIDQNWQAWVGYAHVLEATAGQAIAAIDAKDVDKLSDVGGTLDAACESCHMTFWYPE